MGSSGHTGGLSCYQIVELFIKTASLNPKII